MVRSSSLTEKPGYMWFGSDATARSQTYGATVFPDPVVRDIVWTGFVGLAPSVGQGTQIYSDYAARLAAIPSTLGNGTHCNMATDEDTTNPQYIWAQDHDNDPSTPLACSGDDNQAVSAPPLARSKHRQATRTRIRNPGRWAKRLRYPCGAAGQHIRSLRL